MSKEVAQHLLDYLRQRVLCIYGDVNYNRYYSFFSINDKQGWLAIVTVQDGTVKIQRSISPFRPVAVIPLSDPEAYQKVLRIVRAIVMPGV